MFAFGLSSAFIRSGMRPEQLEDEDRERYIRVRPREGQSSRDGNQALR